MSSLLYCQCLRRPGKLLRLQALTATRTYSTKWTRHELQRLADHASNFSSASQILRQDRQHSNTKATDSTQHSHSHSHSLFTMHSHTHSSQETQAKADLLEHHQAGSRITLIGMGANLGMSVAKGAAGIVFHSSALVADAAHSLSDILGDVVTLYTFRKSRRPVDASHPFGYGRYEALGTLVVSGFLVAAGVGIGMHALEQVYSLLPMLSSTPAAAASSDSVGMDSRAIWFAVASIGINEALFQATMKVGRRTKSDVLVANAWHHRSDALTSLVSVGAIGGAIMGFPVLDPLGGLVVSAMLAKSGGEMAMDAINEITDMPQDAEDVKTVLGRIADHVDHVRRFGDVHCRKSGPFIHVTATAEFDAHATAEQIEHTLWHVRHDLREQLGFVQNIDIDVRTSSK
ncbi:mitochondrial metal transporter [Linderina pennispora]|nr:mitochondrial metal transporter [Linderina pennispora]